MNAIGRRNAGWIATAIVAVAVPLAVHNPYHLQVITQALVLATAVYGLNVLLGYAGLLSLAHAAFYGIGAYTVALLETKVHVPFWPALVAAVAASAVAGALVGLIALRTRGDYFAIFTAAVGVMISIVLTNWQDLTGGNIGISGIPPPPSIGPISFDAPEPKYVLALAGLAVAFAACALLRRSLAGLTLLGIAQNEDLARACGIDTARAKQTAFVISTSLAGLAGAIFAAFIGFLGPDSSGLDVTFDMLVYLIVGGVGTLAGPLVGTFALIILTQVLQGVDQYRLLIFGPMLVIIVLFFPAGIVGGFDRLRGAAQRGRRSAGTAGAAEATVP